jgi:hypothetical protein
MKPLFLVGVGLLILNLFSIGQSNNSYNQTGVDMVNYAITLQTDIKNGDITSLDCETVDKYSELFNLVDHRNCDLAQSTYSTLSASGFNYANYINSTTLSSTAKSILIDLCDQSATLTSSNFAAYIEDKVTDINASSLSQSEKEIILKVCAFGYNAMNNETFARKNEECNGCQFIGGVVGIIGGSILCGPICGIVGGLAGWIVGGIIGGNK